MNFKRLSLVCLLLTLVSSYAWAEKYEFVRLGVDTRTDPYNSTAQYHLGDSIELKSGDVAKVIGVPYQTKPLLLFWDGETYTRFLVDDKTNLIVGPGTLIAAYPATSFSPKRNKLHIAIQRSSDTGSTTLAWNGNDWTKSSNAQQANNNSSSPVPDPNGIKYDSLLGWVWFTDTPWMYSYTNGSWYYMRSSNDGIYVWNANLPNSGWMKLHG